MQKIVYSCDECGKAFGDHTHISLQFGGFSGIAVPVKSELAYVPMTEKEKVHWEVREKVNGKFMHFCNGVCLGRFFAKKIKKAQSENKDARKS